MDMESCRTIWKNVHPVKGRQNLLSSSRKCASMSSVNSHRPSPRSSSSPSPFPFTPCAAHLPNASLLCSPVPADHPPTMHLRRPVVSPERRNPCTHMTMTRLFDPYASFRCSLCHKHPNIGWLYRCTQDSRGFLPESDFTNAPVSRERSIGHDLTAHTLSASIVRSIGEGRYTSDQVKALIGQKERVRDLALGQTDQQERPPTASTADSGCSSTDGTFSTLPPSTTFSTASSTELDEEIKAAYDWKELQKMWMSEPSIPPPACQIKPLPHRDPPAQTPEIQPCNFKICPTCRPTYRERAYQSLDDVLSNPIKIPPIWELSNRRVSDAKMVARIGLPKSSRFYAHTPSGDLLSTHSIPDFLVDPADQTHFHSSNDPPFPYEAEAFPTVDDTHSVRRRSGFRQTVRRALAKARSDDFTLTSSSTHDAGPRELQPSRSLIFRRQRSRPTLSFVEAHGRVVDTSSLQDSVMLMLATNTPLPHTPVLSSYRWSWVEGRSSDQTDNATSFPFAGFINQA